MQWEQAPFYTSKFPSLRDLVYTSESFVSEPNGADLDWSMQYITKLLYLSNLTTQFISNLTTLGKI